MDPSVEFVAGPLLVLICIALILFGTLSAQVYYYWLTYEDDPITMKLHVGALWLLEIVHTCFCIHIIYYYLITHFGDTDFGLDKIVWTFPATILLEIQIVCLSQGLYIRRIWNLSKKSILITAVPSTFLFARSCFSIGSVSFLYHYDTWVEFHAHIAPPATVNCAFTLAVATDITIACLLLYYLYIRRTKFPRTKHIIQTLMLLTINTGAVTIIFSVGVLATFNLFKMSLLFGGIIEIISKLYANSMLAMLNARQTILQRTIDSGPDAFNAVQLSRPRVQEARIQIYTETAVTSDVHDMTGLQLSKTTTPTDFEQDVADKVGDRYALD